MPEAVLHLGAQMDARSSIWLRQIQHLAAARSAVESGHLDRALNEVDAALALGGDFVAAQSLRREILARSTAVRPPAAGRPAVPWLLSLATVVLISGMVVGRDGAIGIARRPSPATAAYRAPEIPIPSASAPASLKIFLARPPSEMPATGVTWISSRLNQLGVRPNWHASAVRVEDAELLRDLGEGISQLWVGKVTSNADAIFLGDGAEDDWTTLTASLKPSGVVWLIHSNRTNAAAGADRADAPAAAGFVRIKRLRYSEGFVAEQFARRPVRR